MEYIGTLVPSIVVGFSGKIGQMMEVDTEEPSPLTPGLMIPMRASFGPLHRVPCEPGRAPDSCVVMQLRSVIKPGAMEAATMRPYRVTHTKTVDFTMTMLGQGSMSGQALEKRLYRVKYQ